MTAPADALPAAGAWLAAAIVLGACFGSFANVLIHRLPRNALPLKIRVDAEAVEHHDVLLAISPGCGFVVRILTKIQHKRNRDAPVNFSDGHIPARDILAENSLVRVDFIPLINAVRIHPHRCGAKETQYLRKVFRLCS